jgi:hypothetical protein
VSICQETQTTTLTLGADGGATVSLTNNLCTGMVSYPGLTWVSTANTIAFTTTNLARLDASLCTGSLACVSSCNGMLTCSGLTFDCNRVGGGASGLGALGNGECTYTLSSDRTRLTIGCSAGASMASYTRVS